MDEKYCKTCESQKHVFLVTVEILISYEWSLDEIYIISELWDQYVIEICFAEYRWTNERMIINIIFLCLCYIREPY